MRRGIVIVSMAVLATLATADPATADRYRGSDDTVVSDFGYPFAFGPRDIACSGTSRIQILYGYVNSLGAWPGNYRVGAVQARIRETVYDASGVLNSEAEIKSRNRFGSSTRYVCDSSGEPTIVDAGVFSSGHPDHVFRELCKRGFANRSRAYLLFLEGYDGGHGGIVRRTCHRTGQAIIGIGVNQLGKANIRTTTVIHETLHLMGAVNPGAPNAYRYNGGHCRDGRDVMCYGPHAVDTVCRGRLRADCNGNDYFHPVPAAGSWLADNPASNAGHCAEPLTTCIYNGRGLSP